MAKKAAPKEAPKAPPKGGKGMPKENPFAKGGKGGKGC